MSAPRIVIVMGVSGAGKTTVGRALAQRLGWDFIEGDEFHSEHNVALMASGVALTDADREPWLLALRSRIEEILATGGRAVVACSALKHSYRRILVGQDAAAIRFVHLEVPEAELRRRLGARAGHFMRPEMLPSQLSTLEPSTTALHVDGARTVSVIVDEIVVQLGLLT
jgi:carbohydrate kinase (thermoresistant glucokinase family)